MRRRYLVWKIPSKPGGDYAHWKPLLGPHGLAVHAVGDQAVVHRFGDGHARGALHFLGAFSDEGRSGCTSDLALLWNLPLADGASVAIPKFADVKHSGYKPFTFAAGAGRCHPGAAASAPPTMFEPIHPRGILSNGRVNTSHQGTCSKQGFKLAKGMVIDCRTTPDPRGQLASLQPVELHQPAPSQHQHNGLASIKSGLAALRDFDPAYRRYGSFTSFPLSRRVRFAPRAERLLG